MAKPTPDEIDHFLELIKEGMDRATAAWHVNPDYSGSLFRSMCNPMSLKHYDADFAARYDEAVEARGPLKRDRVMVRSEDRAGQPQNGNGFTKAMHLEHGQLQEFLDLVSDGMQAAQAARELDPPTSITQINRRAARDVEFAEAFRMAKEEGYPAYQESLRAEAVRQAFAGDYRALRDQLLMHIPEARVLTTSRHEIGGVDGNAIRVLAEKHFHELPPEILDELIRVVEAREQGALPPAA